MQGPPHDAKPGTMRRIHDILPRPQVVALALTGFALAACGPRAVAPAPGADPGDPTAAVAPAVPPSHILDLPGPAATATAAEPR